MADKGIPEVLANGEVRKTLIDYYKWIVSLAVLIMTISLSLIALIGQDLRYKLLVLVGWSLLVVCIFFDWLFIKRLVTLPIVMQATEVERDQQHKLFVSALGHMKIFGLIQNLAFLFGAGIVACGLALNWLPMSGVAKLRSG
jgi:hypothetical protein